MHSHKSGFTLMELMIVLLIIGLLAAILVPNVQEARVSSIRSSCIRNLFEIEGAKSLMAIENGWQTGYELTVADYELPALLMLAPDFRCPGGGTYTGNIIGTPVVCSLEVDEGHFRPVD